VLRSELGRRSPLSIGAIVDLSLEAYGVDLRFYLTLALAAFAGQALVGLAGASLPGADLWLQGANLAVDAFLAGCVSVGVAARLQDAPVSPRWILSRIARRWWAIAFVDLVVWLIRALTFDSVFGGLQATGYFTFAIPTLVLWGSLLFADVVASIDDTIPAPALPGLALLQSLLLSWRLRNLWRVGVLSLMTVPALMLPMILDDALKLHAVPMHAFWASIPLDALLVGPYQALFTVFYLDLRAREDRQR
jgi:hypothetical protein